MFWKLIILYFQSKWHLEFVKQKKKKTESWHTKQGNLTATKKNPKNKTLGAFPPKSLFNLWGLVLLYLQLCSLTPQITKPLLCSYPPHLHMALPFQYPEHVSHPSSTPPNPWPFENSLHPLPHLWMLPLASYSKLNMDTHPHRSLLPSHSLPNPQLLHPGTPEPEAVLFPHWCFQAIPLILPRFIQL